MTAVFSSPHSHILVTGAGGQLGRELSRQLGPRAVPCDRAQLDLTCPEAVFRTIRQIRPTIVINTAALTDVDRAQQAPAAAMALNAAAVADLADATRAIGATLVQISTDYVFGDDRRRTTPYHEGDTPGPVNWYGWSKLEGEYQARRNPRHLVIRTCGLYGYTGSTGRGNFLSKILARAHQAGSVAIVCDQWCSPTSVVQLARAVCFLITTGAYGTYHVVNRGRASWYELGRTFLRSVGVACEVLPVTSDQLPPDRAPRPAYSVLDTTKYHRLGGPSMSSWQIALSRWLATAHCLPDGRIVPRDGRVASDRLS